MHFSLSHLLGLDTAPTTHTAQGVPLKTQGPSEDSAMVPSQQGFTPINADVAHFNQPSQQLSSQIFNPGFTPLQNSGFGPQGNPQIGAFNDPQNQDGNNLQMSQPTGPSLNLPAPGYEVPGLTFNRPQKLRQPTNELQKLLNLR